mmetsp:Transcript_67385/g.133539  ORF Transcript_67385/g.133539 Transcript_67385/m.133539 type:complete len:407 (-) Transcript_67385:436-1656(-)
MEASTSSSPPPVVMDVISRAPTVDAALNSMDDQSASGDAPAICTNWFLRSSAVNDHVLRSSFCRLLEDSAQAPPSEKLIMYDACDDGEVRTQMGMFRKRIDARRNTKPKKPNTQFEVCTPFDPAAFNFGKISNERERVLKLLLDGGRYDILSNKFPLFPKHMLLVAVSLEPQQMTGPHLNSVCQLLQASSFCAYFNSWCASASVNHFHCHLIDEFPPVTAFPLVSGPLVGGVRSLQPKGFPGFCYAFPISSLGLVETAVRAMQEDNQPHNMLFTPRFVYIFPKPLERPARSFELYPETVGGPELIGSFTVYTQEDYDAISNESIDELVRINTAPLPSRLLQHEGGAAADDHAVHLASTTLRASRRLVTQSVTVDTLPSLKRLLHDEDWPQDRPIARALVSNIAPCV